MGKETDKTKSDACSPATPKSVSLRLRHLGAFTIPLFWERVDQPRLSESGCHPEPAPFLKQWISAVVVIFF